MLAMWHERAILHHADLPLMLIISVNILLNILER